MRQKVQVKWNLFLLWLHLKANLTPPYGQPLPRMSATATSLLLLFFLMELSIYLLGHLYLPIRTDHITHLKWSGAKFAFFPSVFLLYPYSLTGTAGASPSSLVPNMLCITCVCRVCSSNTDSMHGMKEQFTITGVGITILKEYPAKLTHGGCGVVLFASIQERIYMKNCQRNSLHITFRCMEKQGNKPLRSFFCFYVK